MATDLERRSDRRAQRPRGIPREALIVAGLAIVGGVVAVLIEPGVATGAIASTRAKILLALFALLFVGLAFLVRLAPSAFARLVILLVPIALLGWFTVRPAFVRTTADEAFPTAAAAAATPAVSSTPAAADVPAATPPAEEAPAENAPTAQDAPAAEETPAESAPTPAEPVVLASGTLGGLTGHTASGSVSTYELADGARVVRFEDVAIQPGPDYFVWLVPGANATAPDGGVELGPLTATDGSFNYDVPADFDTAQPFTVLVWCRAFAVEIASAPQVAA